MSAKLMGMVFDCDVKGTDQTILLALADHADHDGTNCYPSIDYLAWKTGAHRRTVQRVLRKFEDMGVLYCVANENGGAGLVREYHIYLENLPSKPDFVSSKKRDFKKGGKMTPFSEESKKGGKFNKKGGKFDKKGGTAMSPQPYNHNNHNNHPLSPPCRMGKKNIIELFGKIPAFDTAKDFHKWAVEVLEDAGWTVNSEFKIPDRGDGRAGRIDIVADLDGVRLGIELDHVTVRKKSVQKLHALKAAGGEVLCFALLRYTPQDPQNLQGITVLHPENRPQVVGTGSAAAQADEDKPHPDHPVWDYVPAAAWVQDVAGRLECSEDFIRWLLVRWQTIKAAEGATFRNSVGAAFERWLFSMARTGAWQKYQAEIATERRQSTKADTEPQPHVVTDEAILASGGALAAARAGVAAAYLERCRTLQTTHTAVEAETLIKALVRDREDYAAAMDTMDTKSRDIRQSVITASAERNRLLAKRIFDHHEKQASETAA